MITVEHSEALAVWALRMRVWDYLVMPVGVEDVLSRMALLAEIAEENAPGTMMPHPPIPERATVPSDRKPGAPSPSRLLPAVSFLETNYSEKVSLKAAARLCGLDPFQFSRAFKREHGKTFREFLILHRINKAVGMLQGPSASVTNVAFSVGFNDLSHFARMFRRYVGVRPSEYLHERKHRPEGMHPFTTCP
jgi:AraC-like DNA-binding protein